MNKKAFIFPGQGAQVVGMGKDFHDTFSIARETFEEASDILSQNMKELIFKGPMEELSQTKNSQPAIFVTSVAILRTVKEQFPHFTPAICAGLSLGEYTALLASEKIGFEECLKLVAARGALMQTACLEKPGTMRVVLGLAPENIKTLLPSNVWIANVNCPGQVVIAGQTSAMPMTEEVLKANGAKRVLPLEVSGAFHTPFMRSAQQKLEPQLLSANLLESTIEIVMNVPGDFVRTIPDIRSHLINQIVSPTLWEQSIRKIDQENIQLYIEMGPGKTLAGMNRKIGVKTPTVTVEKVTDLELINEAITK